MIDRPAPDVMLRAADGRLVRFADFRGEAVVLNFVYTSCPDICPLHAETIAEVQRLVNDTPMKDRVAFVTHLIDREGVWKANFHGLRFDPVNLVTFVNALTNDTTCPHPNPTKSWWEWSTK